MEEIPDLLTARKIDAPDFICGGTPCQAFSLAGRQQGLNDERGNLTLKFVDIIETNDKVRTSLGLQPSVVFWENVEGVLSDKTNAFGCLISLLAGLDDAVEMNRWPNAGLLRGPKRNVAWRVLDAKYFGLPQQRRRLYVLAGGMDFHPEKILFEEHNHDFSDYPDFPLTFMIEGHSFELFRSYSDCLYSAYGTKWNGNAAAYNGSLFVVQDGRIRRLSPLECERLMGFPDEYTNIPGSCRTHRYQAIGNSWAVTVVRWIGERLMDSEKQIKMTEPMEYVNPENMHLYENGTVTLYTFGEGIIELHNNEKLNCSDIPEKCKFASMKDIISPDADDNIYISPVGCNGIIRRKRERKLNINRRLEEVLLAVAGEMSEEDIEKKSRVQRRGKYAEMVQMA